MDVQEILFKAQAKQEAEFVTVNIGMLTAALQPLVDCINELQQQVIVLPQLAEKVHSLDKKISTRADSMGKAVIRLRDRQEDTSSLDAMDKERVNIFFAVLEKFGSVENVTLIQLQEVGIKINSVIYARKMEHRLWLSFSQFKNDYNSWVKREGHWALHTNGGASVV